jgi:hypothetical protein
VLLTLWLASRKASRSDHAEGEVKASSDHGGLIPWV